MWFKVWARHGGGHMGYTEEFVWRDERPSKDEREYMWNDMVEGNHMNNASGGVNLVRVLPEKARLEKVERYKSQIVCAQKMLKILGAPVLEPFVF